MPWKNAKKAKKAMNARAVKKQMIPKVGHGNLIIQITVWVLQWKGVCANLAAKCLAWKINKIYIKYSEKEMQ
jgi:hypothetical protein